MQFRYFRPRDDVRSLASSYYSVNFADPVADIMRAEIANVRFILKGTVSTDLSGQPSEYAAGQTLLCGPTHRASNVTFSAGARVFGAAITPLGWARLFDVSADDLADRIVPLEDHLTGEGRDLLDSVFSAHDDEARAVACDDLFAAAADMGRPVHHVFLDRVTAWITSPDHNELVDLLAELPMSDRQIIRLSRKYFGSAPKLLHRKFRALNSANRLTWHDLTDWRDVASTSYSDQPHFIREFKQFNGRTPGEFIKGTHILVRMTLQERLQIAHDSPFSLIG
ncbi:Helix-turn-helix domain protein [Tsuneonella dongtanensis]|uniref:Helix-turn-helix domain protein n=1 Tax=Tsuneonella dongtanensis TaxID=692370 RepID=A0A1B2AGF0_9SPHN|nr:AraC family transcriptional regulator [Tsuneonella dongtanensis]ANY21222.1 Helix-turn-helix domain protein [Tsuneonella dongtanensis]